MSSEAQAHCRKLDVVTVKGSSVPMPIFTYDALQSQTFPVLKTPKFFNISLEGILKKQAEDYDVMLWETDPDLVQLRSMATPEFLRTYRTGLEYYLGGDWLKAKDFLTQTDQMMNESDTNGDGPSQTLLSYMQARDWKCPSDWDGYRPLTSK
jgi:hypothetical protein